MTVNKGIAPPDIATDVGRLRAIIGDTSFGELDPVEQGFGDYGMFSDDELQVFLEQGESFEGGVFYAYNSLATSAALESKTVKDFDLQVDLTKRASELRALAKIWSDKADALSADIFELFDTRIRLHEPYPELAARPSRPWL